jgi:HEAT repeat protein
VWKRLLIGVLLVSACCLAAVLFFPGTVYVPLALLRREAFFDGKPTNYWIRALKHEGFLGHAPANGDAGKALREGGSAAVPVLCEIAEHSDASVRLEALATLSLLGPDAKAATPVLATALKKEENSTCFILASEALANVDHAAAGEALSAVLRNKQKPAPRAWALTELAKLAPDGQEALPALNEMLHDPNEDPVLRVQAIDALWRLKQPAEPLVSALCAFVTADKSSVGAQALEVLSEMGPAAKPALPTLLKLLQDPSVPLTGRRWGPPHRAAVIRTVGSIGPGASAAVPALLANLDNDNYFIRIEVGLALARIGPSGKQALEARDAVSCTSITLLAAHPPGSLAALPLIQSVIRTWVPREAQTQEAIREAVLRIDPDSAPQMGGGNR